MSKPEGPTEGPGSTPSAEFIAQLEKDMRERPVIIITDLYLLLSDSTLREKIENHPDIGADAVRAYEALGSKYNDAVARIKADPKDNMAWADYHRSCGDIIMIGGPLLDKIKAAGIKPVMQ